MHFFSFLFTIWTLLILDLCSVLFTAAKNVVLREHTLKNSPIQVELWSPSQQCRGKTGSTMPTSEEASAPPALACYKDRVLVSGVPPDTTTDCLLNYLECVANIDVINIQKKGCLMLVIFNSLEDDLGRCFRLCVCHPSKIFDCLHVSWQSSWAFEEFYGIMTFVRNK